MPAADPYSAAFGAIASLASPAPAGPSDAKSSGTIGANFDNSGWNVTFGNNSGVTSDRTDLPNTIGSAASGMAQYLPYAAVAVVLLIVMKKMKKP